MLTIPPSPSMMLQPAICPMGVMSHRLTLLLVLAPLPELAEVSCPQGLPALSWKPYRQSVLPLALTCGALPSLLRTAGLWGWPSEWLHCLLHPHSSWSCLCCSCSGCLGPTTAEAAFLGEQSPRMWTILASQGYSAGIWAKISTKPAQSLSP